MVIQIDVSMFDSDTCKALRAALNQALVEPRISYDPNTCEYRFVIYCGELTASHIMIAMAYHLQTMVTSTM